MKYPIKKIIIVLFIPSILLGFLITNFTNYNKSRDLYFVGCSISFYSDEKAKSTCNIHSYGYLLKTYNPKNKSIYLIDLSKDISFTNSVEDALSGYGLSSIQIAGILPATIIYNDEIENLLNCNNLTENPNLIYQLINKNDLKKYYRENILNTKSINLSPTSINGLFCAHINFGPPRLIEISPEHINAYNSMVFKSKILNIIIVLWEFITLIAPYISLYLLYFSGLIVFYFIKLNIWYLRKK